MELSIPAFADHSPIPKRHTADGDNISPEIQVSNIPQNAKSLALIVDDPDAPSGLFVHWTIWNIAPSTTKLPEGFNAGIQGTNGFGVPNWKGPSPPPGKAHRYVFKLYALDTELKLKPGSSKEDLESAIEGHIVAKSEYVGTYKR